MAATLLERGHAAWEDQALPIVFLGAANDHGYSNPKIRKRADCYPLSEIAPHRRGKAERAYVLRIRWPELESRGRNASKLLKSPKLNLQLPCSRVFLASPAAAARGNTPRVGCEWGALPSPPHGRRRLRAGHLLCPLPVSPRWTPSPAPGCPTCTVNTALLNFYKGWS